MSSKERNGETHKILFAMRPTLLTHAIVAASYAFYAVLSESGLLFHLLALLFCFIVGAIAEGERSLRFISGVFLGVAVNALAWSFISLTI